MNQKKPSVPRYRCMKELLDSIPQNLQTPAILAPDRKPLTYAGLQRHISSVVSFLNQHGVGRNDTIAVVLPNGPEMATAFLAAASCAACAPLNPGYSKKEYLFYFSDLNVKAVIVPHGQDSSARSVARDRNIPVFEMIPGTDREAGLFHLEGKPASAPVTAGFADAEDVALVLHTSGTTARPKIVPLTQTNILTSAHNVGKTLQLDNSDRCLNVMPLFHIHGLIAALLASINVNAGVVCTPGFADSHFLEWMADFQPTWYTAVPTIHQSVLDVSEKNEANPAGTSLRFIRSSSSSLPPKIMVRLEKRFNVPVIEAYGMTEAAHQMACNPMPPLKRKPGSVGMPAGPEVAIMDNEDTILSAGETGEIVIRGPNVMKGYANNPEANKKSFSQGWLRTGDEGYVDPDGYLTITGRLKEQINRGGQKISPREIDEVLLDHPAVVQAVTFGIPHSRLGESVGVAVVLNRELPSIDEELRSFAAERLAPYKVPQQVVCVDKIPKGPTGKLQRIGLAEKLAHLLKPEFVPPSTQMEKILAEIWSEVLRVEQVGRFDNFFALGGDSLLATQVLARLNDRLQIDLPIQNLFQSPTFYRMAEMISQSQTMQPEDNTIDELLSEIENLSEEEVKKLLEDSQEEENSAG